MNNKWSKEEINFLTINYPLYGHKYCMSKLNKKASIIYNKAYQLKIKINKETKLKNNKIAQREYQNSRPNDSFKVKLEQFLDIKKPEVAYILGYLWADGYVVRNEIRLELIKTDLDAITPILNSIGDWTFSYRKRTGFSESGRAVTSNAKLKAFLVQNDYDKKSQVSADKILNNIPKDLKHYFFRGLVDGDGCIYISKNYKRKRINIAGSYYQDWSYLVALCTNLNITPHIYLNKKINSKSSILELNGRNALIFCNYIYQGKILGLKRKYDKYLILKEKIKLI